MTIKAWLFTVVAQKYNPQKQFFLTLESLAGVKNPIFIDRNAEQWKAFQEESGIKIWSISEDKLVSASQIKKENIIGRYRLTSENSELYELWFDIDCNHDLNTVKKISKNFKSMKNSVIKIIDALRSFKIPIEKIYVKSSGRGFHIQCFTKGIRDDEQFQEIVDMILDKAGLLNSTSGKAKKSKKVIFGIDPAGQHKIKQLFNERIKEDKTVFISTHMLDTAERMCDRVAVIHKGRNIASGNLESLQKLSKTAEHATLEEVFLKLTQEAEEETDVARQEPSKRSKRGFFSLFRRTS